MEIQNKINFMCAIDRLECSNWQGTRHILTWIICDPLLSIPVDRVQGNFRAKTLLCLTPSLVKRFRSKKVKN